MLKKRAYNVEKLGVFFLKIKSPRVFIESYKVVKNVKNFKKNIKNFYNKVQVYENEIIIRIKFDFEYIKLKVEVYENEIS